MEKERQNFVYGNDEEGVKGCIRNGIDEKTANQIYDEMIDFAKYAFNKSHAACYAVVSYQTVSYTHLDVYKRQVRGVCKPGFGILKWPL